MSTISKYISTYVGKYVGATLYIKIACCVAIASTLGTLYYYNVVVPYKTLSAKYITLKVACTESPVRCIEFGRDTIQNNLQNRINHNLQRMPYERPKIISDDNVTTFTFSN